MKNLGKDLCLPPSNTTMPTQTTTSAARDLVRDRVFDTTELLEMILLYLDPKDALLACRINKTCQDTFKGSTLLKRHCFLEQDPDKVASKPTMSDIRCAVTEDENGKCHEYRFKRWPEGMVAGLYNPLFLCFGGYDDRYQDMPFNYETDDDKGPKQLPKMYLEYNDKIQTGYLAVEWPHLSSAELGSLGQMYFTSHPIPKLKVDIWAGNRNPFSGGRYWWFQIEVTVRNPRLGQVIDVVFGVIAKACLAQKQRKERQRELIALQYCGPWDLNIEDESQDMNEECQAFARERGLEKWAKVFDEQLAGVCVDEVEIKVESCYPPSSA
ncbi:hypothetical protein AC579_6726 [Pseudocercospora musae]|uniref:F-box domain-containing protein n=1 Tax=Pseudocercospora musae TaxID=113226 RepID=A0A139HVQ7_9PEZI|nr:hypothetical protein AC579_6726 [Pseudocercospora musae]